MPMPVLTLRNGDEMPALGLGTWKSAPGEVGAAVTEALRIGYRHFDCAPIYGNEAEIGEAFSAAFREGIVRREELWITSKLWNNRHLPADVMPALRRTLADLRLDHLDLFLMHWPIALKPDVHFPEKGEDFLGPDEARIAETWAAMEEVAEAGLCRHVGVSNFSIRRLRQLLETAKVPPEANQVESHPLLAQPELFAFCRDNGIVFTAYSPLGSPDRPERLRRADAPPMLQDPVIAGIAANRGLTPAQVILAWAVCRGGSVIPKSVNPDRLRQNLEAAAVALDEEEMRQLASLDRGYRFLDGAVWSMPGSPYPTDWLWGEE